MTRFRRQQPPARPGWRRNPEGDYDLVAGSRVLGSVWRWRGRWYGQISVEHSQPTTMAGAVAWVEETLPEKSQPNT